MSWVLPVGYIPTTPTDRWLDTHEVMMIRSRRMKNGSLAKDKRAVRFVLNFLSDDYRSLVSMTSPPLRVEKACQVIRLTVSDTKETEPSARTVLTPPVWKLRDVIAA